jgi:hypothetical protein
MTDEEWEKLQPFVLAYGRARAAHKHWFMSKPPTGPEERINHFVQGQRLEIEERQALSSLNEAKHKMGITVP